MAAVETTSHYLEVMSPRDECTVFCVVFHQALGSSPGSEGHSTNHLSQVIRSSAKLTYNRVSAFPWWPCVNEPSNF